MAKLSGKPVKVELCCQKNEDGTYDAEIKVDGNAVPDTDYIFLKADSEDLQKLWKRARDNYGTNPEVGPTCQACFPEAFMEREALGE